MTALSETTSPSKSKGFQRIVWTFKDRILTGALECKSPRNRAIK